MMLWSARDGPPMIAYLFSMETLMATSVVSALTSILANTYALAAKTHGAHWNLTGPQFFALHEAFGAQYAALYEAADELAERIRALEAPAPKGLADLAQAATLPAPIASTDGIALAKALVADHKAIAKTLREAIPVAQSAGDEPTADLFITRAEAHEKIAWMLTATIS